MRPERHAADRDRDRGAGVDHLGAAGEAVGRVHRDRADAIVAEVLLDLEHQQVSPAAAMSSSSSAAAAAGRLIVIAWLISGSLSGKTASITTPWISSIRPTFCSVVTAISLQFQSAQGFQVSVMAARGRS